jgi:hypothetical protein
MTPFSHLKRRFIMFSKKSAIVCAATAALMGGTSLQAATVVGAFGQGGWRSDDTRSSTGTDLVGINNTNAPKPGATPTSADDLAIAGAIVFQSAAQAPAGSDGAVKLIDTGTPSKTTISTISEAGFAASTSNLTGTFRYYSDSTASAPQLKVGIRSPQWGTGAGQSQNGFSANHSGESSWDLLLVAELDTPTANAWTTYTLDGSTKYRLFDQAGNSFFPSAGGYGQTGTDNQYGLTLSQWAASSYATDLFGTGATINNIQLGLGSGAPASNGWVDNLTFSPLNGGQEVNFVPEPSSLALVLGLGGLALLSRRPRRSKA